MKRSVLIFIIATISASHAVAQNFESVRDSISSHVRLFVSNSISHYDDTDHPRNKVMHMFIDVFDARKTLEPDDYYEGIITSEERDEMLQKMSSLRMEAFALLNDLFYADFLGVSDGQEARDVDMRRMVCCMTLSMISGSWSGVFFEQARNITTRDTWYSYPHWYTMVSVFEILLRLDFLIGITAKHADNPEDIEEMTAEFTEAIIAKFNKLNSYLTNILENHGYDVDMEELIDYVNGLMQAVTAATNKTF